MLEGFDLYTKNAFEPLLNNEHSDVFDLLVSSQKSVVISHADTPIYMLYA